MDTNGQNNRYKRAADKHGSHERVISALAIGKTDPAGVVGRFKAAADKLGGLHIRSVSKAKYEYLQFPVDVYWDRRRNDGEILRLIQQADVLHLNNSEKPLTVFRAVRKPTLIHHHGSLFRSNPPRMLQLAASRRWVSAVSTIDLLQPAPDQLHWLPTAYDIKGLAKLRREHKRKPDDRIRLVSAPTNRAYKSTDLLVQAVSELQDEGLPLDLELVENRTNAECLVAKAQADIVFDQLMFGYGCNAVEAWGMGIPVISGGDDWTLAEMRRQWGALPFYEATPDTLKDRIRKMVESKDLRAEWGAKGKAHALRYHDELPALTRLAELYWDSIQLARTARSIPGKPAFTVTFKSTTQKRIAVPGASVEFVNGEAQVSDPMLVTRLRTLVKRRGFGIEEVTEGARRE